jgi:cytosine permease
MTNETKKNKETIEDLTKEEFHSVPVPLAGRRGFGQPAWVWSGFGIAWVCLLIGAEAQRGLGTATALIAILLGNFILFCYSAGVGYACGKWGTNFPLTVKYVFGSWGARVPILILAFLVTGWFAFQAWLTTDVLRVAFGFDRGTFAILALIIGFWYAAAVLFGFTWMATVSKICIPVMIVFALYYLFTRVFPSGGALFTTPATGKVSFMLAVAMAWSSFVVSGTMTGDIVRYCKTGKQAVWVTAVAFMFSNAPFMIMGCLFSAAMKDPTITYFLDSRAAAVMIPLLFVAFLSNWTTCDACLYNASMGFTNAFKGWKWRKASIFGCIIGLIAAATGLVSDMVPWLILLGLLVPPIGGVIIADYYFIRGDKKCGFSCGRDAKINWAAIIALIVGVIVAYYVNANYPKFLFGVAGIIASFVVYLVLVKIAGSELGADISTTPTGAEAID